MKKLFFIGLAATAMLVSCNNDETVEMVQSKAIQFDGFVNKSTRGEADDITNATISNFSVYGFVTSVGGQIFTNETVTGSGTGNDGSWSYTNTQYWTAGKDYYFSAIAPATNAQWTYDVNGTVEGGIITFTNGDGKQDLLYAYSGKITTPETLTAQPNKVGFTFNHLLARVKFNFTNGMKNDNTKLVVRDVKITDANNKATCNVANEGKTWTLANDNAAGELAFDAVPNAETQIAKDASIATDHKYMIPQKQGYKLSFVVDMYQGSELMNSFTHTDVTVPETDMLAGNSYMFTAALTPENIGGDDDEKLYPIEFTVTTVNDWSDDWEEGTVTVPDANQQ